MKSKIAIAATVLAVAMTCAFTQSGTTAIAGKKVSHPLICDTSYNPYAEPVSALRSCGDLILKLKRVSRLPGGGQAYDYGAYTQVVPPSHFNVLKASDRRLQEYDLPTRHELGSQWSSYVKNIRHFARPLPYLVEIPTVHTTAPKVRPEFDCLQDWPSETCTWSGYAAYQGHSYDYVSAVWQEPAFASDPCDPTAFVQWVGIGGFYLNSTDLGQDGTAFGVPGLAAHQAWIETINDNNSPIVGVNLTATKGQQFSAITTWDSSDSKFEYNMGNIYTGTVFDGNSSKVTADQRSAEVIAERPVIDGSPSDLTDYQQFPVDGAIAGWGTSHSFFVNLPTADVSPVSMYDDNGNLMSSESALGSEGNNWTMYYDDDCS
jgi:hypothetical protein